MTGPERQPPPVERISTALGAGTVWTIVLGCALAVVGAISGIVLAMHSTVIECPDGTVIADGADPNCYAYPDAAEGVAILFVSLVLLVLVLLAGRILFVVNTWPRADPA